MRTLILRRTLQALLVLVLLALALDWAQNAQRQVSVYVGWSAFLTLVILFLGPWWIERKRTPDPLLAKPRNLWMAIVVYGLFLLTNMPVVTIWAVIWAGMGAYTGVSLLTGGQIGFGLLTAAIPFLGVLALYTLWALARFYVREPRRNPPAAQTVRYLAGLVIGVGIVVFIWTAGDIWGWGAFDYSYVLLGSLMPLIPTVFFVLLMLWNRLRPRT